MPTPNIKELRAIQAEITAYPEEWYQGLYGVKTSCGTALCFAGHAVDRAGATIYWEKMRNETISTGAAIELVANDCRLPHYKREHISITAQRILGLTGLQAGQLFNAGNGLKDIDRIIGEIASSASV